MNVIWIGFSLFLSSFSPLFKSPRNGAGSVVVWCGGLVWWFGFERRAVSSQG